MYVYIYIYVLFWNVVGTNLIRCSLQKGKVSFLEGQQLTQLPNIFFWWEGPNFTQFTSWNLFLGRTQLHPTPQQFFLGSTKLHPTHQLKSIAAKDPPSPNSTVSFFWGRAQLHPTTQLKFHFWKGPTSPNSPV